MAGTERTSKLTGFEALGLLTGTHRGGDWSGPLPELTATSTATVSWQANVGRSRAGLAPAITPSAIYAAASDGTLVRIDPDSGRTVWRISAGMPRFS